MRFVIATLLTALVAGAASASGSTAAAPTLRVGNGQSLAIVGAGFAPRAFVRLRLTGPGIARQATVRAGLRGGFTLRFAGLERCSVDEVRASTTSGARARVPVAWFVRECPPPPPLAPGVSVVD